MKKLFLSCLISSGFLLLFINSAFAAVVINQVLYDPISSETTGEALELYNNGMTSVDISGWFIKTGASEQDAMIPAGALIQPGQFYLITDKGWNISKEINWRDADFEETINMYNSNSGVGLLDNNFNLIDAVGWGAVNDTELFMGTPATHATPGNVLLRINVTNNNSIDFIEAAADFSPKVSGSEIILEINVVSPLNFDIKLEPDDSTLAGFQLLPEPGLTKRIYIAANTSNANLTLFADFMNQSRQMAFAEGQFSTFFDLPFFMAPGFYNVTVYTSNFEKRQSFEYLGLAALEVDTNKIAFEEAMPGSDVYVYGDKDIATKNKATIYNIGNLALNVAVSGTDLVSAAGKINVTNVMFSFDNSFDYLLSDRLDYISTLLELGLSPAATKALGFKLKVPYDAVGGRYAGKVTVVGVAG